MAEMLIPRIGAILLLVGFGFAVAQVGRLMYVVARQGYSSWVGVAILIAPTAIVGLASAILVLRRHPLGTRLALPFCVLLAVTAAMTFFDAPPVGRFLDDYERASLERGVDVPPYLAEKGTTPAEYVRSETDDVRSQGALGAIALLVVYVATVVRGSRARLQDLAAKRQSKQAKTGDAKASNAKA
jgi:hypothetical protein